MIKRYTVKHEDANYEIAGASLVAAIEASFPTIALKAGAGNAAGYRLEEVKAEYAPGILGGKGGCRLTIKATGHKLPHGMEGETKESEVWIYATREDIPAPHVFAIA